MTTQQLDPAPGPGPWQAGILAFTTICDACRRVMHEGDRHAARTTGETTPGPYGGDPYGGPRRLQVYERRCLACAEATGVLPAEQEAS
jgi:hypothetical protein